MPVSRLGGDDYEANSRTMPDHDHEPTLAGKIPGRDSDSADAPESEALPMEAPPCLRLRDLEGVRLA